MPTVRVALANLRPGATRDEAVTLAVDAVRAAGESGALVVAFPECYLPGYRWPDVETAPIAVEMDWLEGAWDAVADAAREAGVGVVLGTERVVDGRPHITALMIDRDGTRLGFQDKVQLDPSEDALYVAGEGRRVFTVGPLTFGIAICHEGFRYPETVRWAARRGAQVVFHPHASREEPGAFVPSVFADARNSFHEKAVLCRAAENGCYVASINYAAPGSPTTSVVANPDGTVLAWQPYGVEGLLVVEIELEQATGLLALRHRETVAAG